MHLRSLISIFVICSLVFRSRILNFKTLVLASVTEQAGLSRTWSHIPKAGFLKTWLILPTEDADCEDVNVGVFPGPTKFCRIWCASASIASFGLGCINIYHMSCLMTMAVHPAKTQIRLGRLGIHPVWTESSLSAWRKLGPLATHLRV